MNHETHTISPTDDPDHDPAVSLTPAEINHHIARANRLRAEMVSRAMSAFGRWLVSPFRRTPTPEQLEPAANALAAIRSAVEILRDTPDLNAGERRRFTEIILREEARLEAMLNVLRGRPA